jgi:hypothetical protein
MIRSHSSPLRTDIGQAVGRIYQLTAAAYEDPGTPEATAVLAAARECAEALVERAELEGPISANLVRDVIEILRDLQEQNAAIAWRRG